MDSKKSFLTENLAPDNLHHANLLEGDSGYLINELKSFLEESFNFKAQGNPNFWSADLVTFGVNEAREVIDFQSKKGFKGERKVIVISSESFTLEAQNSLLKVLEDPAPNTVFFIISPSTEIFLPTFISRVRIVKVKKENRLEDFKSFALSFYKNKPARRLELVADMIEKKDKSQTLLFLNALEEILKDDFADQSLNNNQVFLLEEVLKCRSFLKDRSPSVKIILEHISLVMPVKTSHSS